MNIARRGPVNRVAADSLGEKDLQRLQLVTCRSIHTRLVREVSRIKKGCFLLELRFEHQDTQELKEGAADPQAAVGLTATHTYIYIYILGII